MPIAEDFKEFEENGHKWWKWRGWICCKKCSIIRRADGKNKPCPGNVKIGLREKSKLRRLSKQSQKDTERFLKGLDKFEERSRKSKIVVKRK